MKKRYTEEQIIGFLREANHLTLSFDPNLLWAWQFETPSLGVKAFLT